MKITPQYLIKSINQHTKEISGFKFEFKFIVWNTNLKHQSSKVYIVLIKWKLGNNKTQSS